MPTSELWWCEGDFPTVIQGNGQFSGLAVRITVTPTYRE